MHPLLTDEVQDVEHPFAEEKEERVEDEVVGEENRFEVRRPESDNRHRDSSRTQRVGSQRIGDQAEDEPDDGGRCRTHPHRGEQERQNQEVHRRTPPEKWAERVMEYDENEEADYGANRSTQVHRVAPGGRAAVSVRTESRLIVSRRTVSRCGAFVVSTCVGRRTGAGPGGAAPPAAPAARAALSAAPSGAMPF